jgi:hypothetical protein
MQELEATQDSANSGPSLGIGECLHESIRCNAFYKATHRFAKNELA